MDATGFNFGYIAFVAMFTVMPIVVGGWLIFRSVLKSRKNKNENENFDVQLACLEGDSADGVFGNQCWVLACTASSNGHTFSLSYRRSLADLSSIFQTTQKQKRGKTF